MIQFGPPPLRGRCDTDKGCWATKAAGQRRAYCIPFHWGLSFNLIWVVKTKTYQYEKLNFKFVVEQQGKEHNKRTFPTLGSWVRFCKLQVPGTHVYLQDLLTRENVFKINHFSMDSWLTSRWSDSPGFLPSTPRAVSASVQQGRQWRAAVNKAFKGLWLGAVAGDHRHLFTCRHEDPSSEWLCSSISLLSLTVQFFFSLLSAWLPVFFFL